MPDLQKSIASQHETYMPNIPHHRRLEAGVIGGPSCRGCSTQVKRWAFTPVGTLTLNYADLFLFF
jgi:hypothetical protein